MIFRWFAIALLASSPAYSESIMHTYDSDHEHPCPSPSVTHKPDDDVHYQPDTKLGGWATVPVNTENNNALILEDEALAMIDLNVPLSAYKDTENFPGALYGSEINIGSAVVDNKNKLNLQILGQDYDTKGHSIFNTSDCLPK